jgi:flagellin-like protein
LRSKGVSPIIASILLILIVVASAAVVYTSISPLAAIPPSQAPTILENLKIVQVSAEGNYLKIYVLNRGGVDATVDAVYVESTSGTLLLRQPVYYYIPAGEAAEIVIPKGTLDLTVPLNFKLASQRGVLTSSLAIVQTSVIPPAPSLYTFYPTTSTITIGSYVGGSLPSSVQYIDGSYYTIASSPSVSNPSYHPSYFTTQQGSHVNGSLSLLQSQDSQSMYFLSSPSAQISRIYNASSYTVLNGSFVSGSLPDTYAWDNYLMKFSAQTVSQSIYPITNMNFTSDSSGWSGYASESSPVITPSTVTLKSSGLVSANQRAVARTSDPDKTIHVVYSNGTYLGYSLSVDGGVRFVDQWFISSGAGYEPGYNPSVASDINNNIHITYQNSATSPQQIRYILMSYNSSYGGNPRTSTSYQNVSATTSWAGHFIAMGTNVSEVLLYVRNASASSSRLLVEIRSVLSDGTPDMSPSGLVASVNLTSVPSSFTWVSAPLNATLNKGSQYAIVLSTNGAFYWAYSSTSYAGSLGGWRYTTGWTLFSNTHFCLMIPGWSGWTSSTPITIYSVTGTTTVQRPVIALYPYLTSLDQQFYSTASYSSVYGNYYFAQSFTPSSSTLGGLMLYLYRTGNPPDNLYFEIRRSNGSYPDMSPSGIISSGRIDAGRVNDAAAAQWFDCILPQPAYLNVSQTYWIVVYSPSSTSANCWRWYYSSTGGYAGGNAANSSDGGITWTNQAWDFSFRTHASRDERPAISWYYQASSGTNRLQVQFLRCLPGSDPSSSSSWYNYAGTGTTPDSVYGASATAETRVSMTFQPNTNSIYFFFTRSNNLYYNRIYRWNPGTGNWGAMGTSSLVISGVNLGELSSAPEPYNDWVVFAATSSSTGYSYVRYYTSSNAQVDISPPSTPMRYPSVTCIVGRVYVLYQSTSGISYRYYNGTWSGENLYYGSSTSSLPNSLHRPSASSLDFVWLNGTSQILYGSVYPTGLVKVLEPSYDPGNGNPGGSGGGSFKFEVDDGYSDYSFYQVNISFYTNFTSPPSWDYVNASFAWRFELAPSQKYNYGNFSHVKLNSVKLLLADTSGNDIALLYNDDNGGYGWVGVTAGYFYRTGIPVTYAISPGTPYMLKVTFDMSCSDPSDLSHITARIDDTGLDFVSSSSIFSAEFSGTSDTDDWSSISINLVSNISEIPAHYILRVYNFDLGRYPVYGEEGYFDFFSGTLDEEYRSLNITYGANSFRNSTGGWLISLNVICESDTFALGLNMLNFVPHVNVHTISVEFGGTGDDRSWTSLLWNATQAFSLPSVSVTIQLYNYSAGAYQTSGFGYISYTSGPAFSYESFSQTNTVDPEDFRGPSGNWRLLVTATRVGQQFYMLNDYILYSPTAVSQQQIDAYFTFTGIGAGTIINMTYSATTLFTASSVNVRFQIWDYSTSSWSTVYSVNYTSSLVPNTPETVSIIVTGDFWRYLSSGESRLRVYALKSQPGTFNFNADQIKLEFWAF